METQTWAAEQLSINVTGATLIAAHGWEVPEALPALKRSAFIEREGQPLYPLPPRAIIF